MTAYGLPTGAFDELALFIVAFGLWRGWKNGLPNEWLPLTQWALILLVGALAAEPLGEATRKVTGLSSPAANVCAYLALALALKLAFIAVGPLPSEGTFAGGVLGGVERGLGIVSGGLRYAATVLLLVAALGAFDVRGVREAAHSARRAGQPVPARITLLLTAQDLVLCRSVAGTWIQEHLGFLLVAPAAAAIPLSLHPTASQAAR